MSETEITVTESEISVPQNPKPKGDASAKQQWHVHLEVGPEELVALHRLGLTGGGLAWREGMESWQPLARGQSAGGPRPKTVTDTAQTPAVPAPPKPVTESATPTGPTPEMTAQDAAATEAAHQPAKPRTETATPPPKPARLAAQTPTATAPPKPATEVAAALPKPMTEVAIAPSSATETPTATGHRPVMQLAVVPAPKLVMEAAAAPQPATLAPKLEPKTEARAGRSEHSHAGSSPSLRPAVIARGKPVPATNIHPFSHGEPPPIPTPPRLPSWSDGLSGPAPEPMTLPRAVAPAPAPTRSEQAELLREKIFGEAKPTSIPPVALELGAKTALPRERARMWLGVGALVVLAAGTGALVAVFLAWNLFVNGSGSANTPVTGAAAGSAQCPVPNPTAGPSLAAMAGSTTPAQISVDQLPLAGQRDSQSSETVMSSAGGSRREARFRTSTSRRSPNRIVLSEESLRRAKSGARPKADGAAAAAGAPDVQAITRAVARAAGAAASCGAGPESGRVEVSFAPSGGVSGVRLLQGFGEAGINSCVLRAMGRAKVPAFTGNPVSVRKTVSW